MTVKGDARFIRHLRAGRGKAFNELVLGYKDRVFNLSYRFHGDWQEANELAREVFISLNKNIRSFRVQSGLSTRIYKITLDMCKSRLANLRSEKNKITAGAEEVPGTVNLRVLNAPNRLLEKKELEMSVQAAINALPEERKEVLLLRDIEGLSYREISEILAIEEKTLKLRLNKARQVLRDGLAGVIDV